MTKRLAAKVGTYQKEGQTKGEYAKIGVILQNDNGEYLLLDPTVSLAGVLAKQNVMLAKEGKPPKDMVACSIFDDSNQGNQPQQQGYQQAPPQQQGYQNTPPQQQGQHPAQYNQQQQEPTF